MMGRMLRRRQQQAQREREQREQGIHGTETQSNHLGLCRQVLDRDDGRGLVSTLCVLDWFVFDVIGMVLVRYGLEWIGLDPLGWED